MKSHTPQVNQGSWGMGAHVTIVAPVASPRKNAARRIACFSAQPQGLQKPSGSRCCRNNNPGQSARCATRLPLGQPFRISGLLQAQRAFCLMCPALPCRGCAGFPVLFHVGLAFCRRGNFCLLGFCPAPGTFACSAGCRNYIPSPLQQPLSQASLPSRIWGLLPFNHSTNFRKLQLARLTRYSLATSIALPKQPLRFQAGMSSNWILLEAKKQGPLNKILFGSLVPVIPKCN